MGEWSRQTPWRQGQVLPDDAFRSLLPSLRDSDFDVAVVISHDCDLAQPPNVEPVVEVIPGKRIERLDGNHSFAKNARRLNLSYTGDNAVIHIDLSARDRTSIGKLQLADYEPNGAMALGSDGRSILQRWLSLRYRRSAFPDEFDRRLEVTGVPERMKAILKPLGSVIVAVYFDVDKGQEVNPKSADEPYALFIHLLYTEQNDPECLNKAQDAAKKIERLFRERYYNAATRAWRDIELEACEPISDHAMTIAQSLNLMRWNADYISLRASPQHTLPAD
jgi:hypothetical protein